MSARQQAEALFQQAYHLQLNGKLNEAIALYTRSIEIFPTAEAYTFRGWSYSFLGDYSRAIDECLQAIALDPSYGNPYNDIGAYLIEQGRWAEAAEWLQKALRASRYASPCFPLFNLGRVYERRRDFALAEQHYRQALEQQPSFKPARAALTRVRSRWN